MKTENQSLQTGNETLHSELNQFLKFLTCGSVDDGKSTLIGRMLYDSGSVYEDHINDATKSSKLPNGQIDYSLFVDGLLSEREQGITIDVAYRYFNTNKTKFIIADSPGHKQYTRNMTVAASNSDAAILLIDASRGIQEQTLRHSFVLNLFGIKDVIIAVNKIDKVEYSYDVFSSIVEKYKELTKNFSFEKVFFIPVSAIEGDNVVHKSQKTQWYNGLPLLETLELIASLSSKKQTSLNRMLVQNSIRTDLSITKYGRGYHVLVASGKFECGQEVQIFPSGKTSTIKTLVYSSDDVPQVSDGHSATVFLKDEIDVSRGSVISSKTEEVAVSVADSIHAKIIAFETIDANAELIFNFHHTSVKGVVSSIESAVDFSTLQETKENLAFIENQILSVNVELATLVAFDLYQNNRKSGSFIIIDPVSNRTVGAGVILKSVSKQVRKINQEERYIEFIRKMKNLIAEYDDVASGI